MLKTGEAALFDPRSDAYLRDPYAYLADARRRGPVHLDPASGLWFLLGYDEVDVGLAAITRRYDDDQEMGRHGHFPDNPFGADGPGHTGPRRLVMPSFSNRAIQHLRDRAQQIVDGALDGKADGDDLRVVDEIGFPLPYHLTCDLLGVPEVDNLAELRDWTWRSLALIDAFLTREEIAENLQAAALAAHLKDVIAWKRDHMADDVMSAIIAAGDEGTVMKPAQVVPFLHTLYLAGMHTTVNQTALSLHALLEHRSQWNLLRDQPALIPNAVEELLRFEPTAQYMTRSTYNDYRVGDVVIPEGSDVVAWIASANRDESRFGADADVLDITRTDARNHLAFGKGPHVCVGSWLARLELQVVVDTVIGRFPNTELGDQELVWTSNVIRGPEELTIRLRS